MVDSRVPHPPELDFWGKMLCWFLEPPPKIRFKALAKFQPVECGTAAVVLPTFLSSQDRLLAASPNPTDFLSTG